MTATDAGMPQDGLVTAITPTQRDPARATIRVNGRVTATLPATVIADLGLAVGQPWRPADAARVADAAAFVDAYRAISKRIDRRPLSRKQAGDKMRQLGIEEPLRLRVLNRLEELGLLDDETLGRRLIEEWRGRKPAGPALLRAKLYQRGIDRGVVDRLLKEAAADPARDDAAEAAELATRRLAKLGKLDPAVARRRVAGLLARRGFSYDVIDSALTRATRELQGDPDPDS